MCATRPTSCACDGTGCRCSALPPSRPTRAGPRRCASSRTAVCALPWEMCLARQTRQSGSLGSGHLASRRRRHATAPSTWRGASSPGRAQWVTLRWTMRQAWKWPPPRSAPTPRRDFAAWAPWPASPRAAGLPGRWCASTGQVSAAGLVWERPLPGRGCSASSGSTSWRPQSSRRRRRRLRAPAIRPPRLQNAWCHWKQPSSTPRLGLRARRG
mmetsp:Transcript_6001/g.25177  ORF Transcript_6001/g.25177 Transcript_6001/m.25177 type:complete len:213 (+) Transcript_6001:1373-2011(+)